MTQQTNENPPTHSVVLDLVNDNANDAESRLSKVENTAVLEYKVETFYFDWATGAVVSESAITTPSGDISKATRSTLSKSSITTPNGDALSEYEIISINAQFYAHTASVPAWQDGQSSTVRNAGSTTDRAFGLQSFDLGDEIGTRCGDAGYSLNEGWNTIMPEITSGSGLDAAPCRIKIKAIKQLG